MIIGFILALLLGIIAGTITGLIPGIHINLVSILLLSFSPALLSITAPITLVTFIVAMAITHTFLDFIPSILLGAPEEDSLLSVLPGHQLLMQGRGYFAIIYTLNGGLIALVIILIFTPIFIYLLPIVYPFIQKIMPLVLITIAIYLVFMEEKEKRLWALCIFLTAGFLGIAALNLNLKEPLLPLLTGLFGASSLIMSIHQETKIPPQRIVPLYQIRLNKKSLTKETLGTVIASPFTAFLPGLGASQAAVIGTQVCNIKDQREFLFLLGAISTIVMGLSFVTFYTITKMRTGAAVAVAKLIPELSMQNLITILITIILSGLLAYTFAVFIAKIAIKNITKINYKKLSLITLATITLIVIIFADYTLIGKIKGLVIFITATALGIFTINKNIRRINLMSCLLIPTILF